MAAVGPEEPLTIAHVGLAGFTNVKRGARMRRPTPRPATLGDYMQELRGRNSFAALVDDRFVGSLVPSEEEATTPARSSGPAVSNYLELPRPITAPTTITTSTTTSDPISPRIPSGFPTSLMELFFNP